MDLVVIVLSWNVRDLLRRCLESVQAGLAVGSLDAAVVVVDNASVDASAAMVGREFPQAHLIAADENLGFTAGNNLALRAVGFTPRADEAPRSEAIVRRPETLKVFETFRVLRPPDFVLLLNPDTEIAGAALSTMVAYMRAHPDVGLLGPKLCYPDGSIQASRRRFPTVLTGFLESTLLQQWWRSHPSLARFYMADQCADRVQDVGWLYGACLMARREALLDVGLLDEGFFMYSEEVDWARRFARAGWRVVYLPSAEVVHHEGRSSEQVVAARHLYFQRSKVRYFRKWHGAYVAEILRAFILLTYAYQLGEEALKWLVGHRRPLRAERVAAYWQVLRSGLRA